ncbi:DNA mismatch repair protein MutL [Geosporobacter subterraneus DSM 17957]|uniref:DNA mismatch repair protein MutL n=1 Tax=Geosporobacter subterraneus DSM 17957 TaxID=1121919 RepID=A0A1M6K7D7_9FIRM|nr:DNA mismatch repair endonuclease MutL [Geosporobacter subterraneus]SHJ54906.1 DNA mismatch repair protein MutL [Geosporobacter subterraneus DSM 17957]
MNNRIHLLDALTANKIAAGEVVDRPASVIKELVENAIDAQATMIVIEIREAGKEYIRISDNGMGIHPSDVEIAFERHATSKITQIEDLDKTVSLGFRGEALASIASVSQVELITKTATSISGIHLELHGGKAVLKKEVGCPTGTTVIVKNLFYNTPARFKFLKNNTSESSYIIDLVSKIALAHPDKSFKLINNNIIVFSTAGTGHILHTITSIYGKELAKNMLTARREENNYHVEAYFSKIDMYRGNRQQQAAFVNGRLIKSKVITGAIDEAYRTLLPINKFPICFLYMKIPPSEIDVNIHPAKTEIKFSNEKLIKSLLISVLKDRLLQEKLIPEIKLTPKNQEELIQETIIDLPTHIPQKNFEINIKEDGVKEDKNTFITNNKVAIVQSAPAYEKNNSSTKELQEPLKESIPEKKIHHPHLLNIRIVGQVFSSYLVGDDGLQMYLIDQHAAHEKIIYEQLLEQYREKRIYIQQLLAPIIVELSPAEFEKLQGDVDIFEKMGFEVEVFGRNAFLIRSVPLQFGEPETKSFFMEIIENYNEAHGPSDHNLKVERIITMACKAAVKAKDRLDRLEMHGLMRQLSYLENPYTCPHGRPVIVSMSKLEIEKKFKRS